MNEDMSLQMVIGSECSIAVNTNMTLWVRYSHRSIIIHAEDLKERKDQRRDVLFTFKHSTIKS